MNLSTPLVPRGADGVLRVIIPGRISKPSQDPESIDSQHEDAEGWLRRVYTGPLDPRVLGEQASGWLADRDTMREAKALVESGEWDAVVATELREIYRNPAFHWEFVQLCLDHKVRVILIADNVDTADENWEIMMYVASMRHGMTVPEVRRRVKRKATHSFSHGGMVGKVRYGYRKLSKEEAATGAFGPVGLRIAKVAECTPTIREMRERVVRGDAYPSITDWLHDAGINPGPYVTSGRWTERVVRDLLGDPILSGQRRFRVNLHTMVYKTGRHRSEPNPKGPVVNEYPELAHFTPEEHAVLLAAMEARKRPWDERPNGKDSPRWNMPRTRTKWPGQHAVCSACEDLMYRYDVLKCRNAAPGGPRTCWNRLAVRFDAVCDKVIPWVLGVLNRHPEFQGWMADAAWDALERDRRRRSQSDGRLDDLIAGLKKQQANLAKAIANGGELEGLVAELKSVEKELATAKEKKRRLEEQAGEPEIELTREEMEARLPEVVMNLAMTSFDFADVLRRLLPVFVIEPVQALDCPQVRARARLTLRLDAWSRGEAAPPEESVTLDLFDLPEHIKHMAACVAAKRADPKASARVIAETVGAHPSTVRRALRYAKLMEQAGTTDPFRTLTAPPAKASRWGRRKAA
jgi:site-specific DNA recombinase